MLTAIGNKGHCDEAVVDRDIFMDIICEHCFWPWVPRVLSEEEGKVALEGNFYKTMYPVFHRRPILAFFLFFGFLFNFPRISSIRCLNRNFSDLMPLVQSVCSYSFSFIHLFSCWFAYLYSAAPFICGRKSFAFQFLSHEVIYFLIQLH